MICRNQVIIIIDSLLQITTERRFLNLVIHLKKYNVADNQISQSLYCLSYRPQKLTNEIKRKNVFTMNKNRKWINNKYIRLR